MGEARCSRGDVVATDGADTEPVLVPWALLSLAAIGGLFSGPDGDLSPGAVKGFAPRFPAADLGPVFAGRCDLSATQFAHATMTNVYFTDCTLDGVAGVSGLKGATGQGQDLYSLAPSLARELGITVGN